jgi:hypothetical protein
MKRRLWLLTDRLPDCRSYGRNRQKRCPKSSATSIMLRSRTLATIAERISHRHAALTAEVPLESSTIVELVAIVTRLIFSVRLCCSYSRPIPHRSSPFSRTAFFCRLFFWALLQAIPASGSFAASAFPVLPLHHRVPSHRKKLESRSRIARGLDFTTFVAPISRNSYRRRNSCGTRQV